MEKMNYVHTIQEVCVGCNKCIFKCPTNAHMAVLEENENKVIIKEGHCISCGECLLICDHEARDYVDDTQKFFDDIKKGQRISVIVAPSANVNFEDVNKVFGFLKALGVNKIYDVSFGADICTWAHVKTIRQNKIKTMISQPCPVVVSYIEKYRPEFINYLSPVQSPAVCTATYLKKYEAKKDKIMFLSPCIGKKREMSTEIDNDTLDYNVTFKKFIEYLQKNKINLNDYESASYDNMQGSIGFAFPSPGGLSDNIKYHLHEDIWIKSIEGIFNIDNYLDQYKEDLDNNKPVPAIVDVLNCVDGCNIGTGTLRNVRFNEIDRVKRKKLEDITKDESEKLMSLFDEKLDINDYKREYFDKSNVYKTHTNLDLEPAYIELGKLTSEQRNINCFACGYGNCEAFVTALAAGDNHKENCKYYLLNKFQAASYVDDLTGVKNRNSYADEMLFLLENHPEQVGVAFADINGLKEANDMFGHKFGDSLIVNCAKILRKVFSKFVYRIGGDEFIILDTDSNEERFKEKIQKVKTLIKKEDSLAISIGWAMSYNAGELEDKIEEADKNMYEEKQNYYKNVKRAERRSSYR